MNRTVGIILATLFSILFVSALLTYALHERSKRTGEIVIAQNTATQNTATQNTAAAGAHVEVRSVTTETTSQNEIGAVALFSELLAPTASPASTAHSGADALGIALRFALAALLAAPLAFRPRRRTSVSRRNPYVAQTQVLLAIVAAAMMIIVGDSAARAFGIFAAASLVSFRTNIRDPKEIAVLLVCLGIGLAAGVGRIDLAIVLSLFVFVTLSILEFLEPRQAFRSMEVCVETRNLDRTHAALKRIFAKEGFSSELRELNRDGEEDATGKVVYHLSLSPVIDMARLNEQIIAADRQNIGSVEWEPKKSTTYIYN